MFRALSRWFVTASNGSARRETPECVVVESYPPLAFAHRRAWSSRLGDWLAASGWRSRSDGRRRSAAHPLEAVAAARLEFADALDDVHTEAQPQRSTGSRSTRSLHELWYLRAEVFSRVACATTRPKRRAVSQDSTVTSRSGRACGGARESAGATARGR